MSPRILVSGLVLLLISGCAVQTRSRSSALDFLYPQGAAAAAPTDVTLQLPVRVGLAFAPGANDRQDTFGASRKQELLERVAGAFRDRESISAVDVIPFDFLAPGGGFDNVDRLRTAFGIDLIVLISYDQHQFSESTGRSWTYWTLIGAYFVKGEKNDTRTVLTATVYDIPSRAMLFHASGESTVGGRTTPVTMQRRMRERSGQGFSDATDVLIAQLDVALDTFQTQAASGTVRGPGTPALNVVDASGNVVGTGGAGSLGLFELALVGLLGLVTLRAARRA